MLFRGGVIELDGVNGNALIADGSISNEALMAFLSQSMRPGVKKCGGTLFKSFFLYWLV